MEDLQKNDSDDVSGKTPCLTFFPDVPPDHKHCLAINCLSFTMGMLLPTRHILFKQNKQEMFEKCRAQFDKLHLDTSSFDVLFYGLNFEELSYPTLLPKPDAGQLAIMPPGKGYESIWMNDGFSLICPKEWQVVLEEDDCCNVKLQLVVDENGLREDGHFKLRLAGTNDFLSGQLQTNYLKWMRTKGESTHEKDTSTLVNLPDAEHTVFGYKCATWPTKFTATWLQGATLHGWPSQEIIERITSAGCHVVPCADKRDCKWKFSFVEAEHILTSVLTLSQRQCFIFLEILIDRWFRSRDVLTPGHLKHLFFNLCEKMDPEKWGQEDGLAFACLTLINDINYALDQENIPNYFIPELNMLRQYVDKDSIISLKENIKRFREAPFLNLYNLFDRYRFEFSPLGIPTGKVFEDISDLIEKCGNDPTAVRLIFFNIASKFWAIDFLEDRIEEGIANLMSANDLLETYFGQRMSCCNQIFKGTSDLSRDLAANIYETYIKVISDDKEAYSATENLACIYHACIHEQQEGTPEYQEYKLKTEETFQKALAMPQASSATKCDYVLFLIKFNKIHEAIDILDDVIKTEINSPEKMSGNMYGKSEIKNVDEILANEINANNEISMLSLVLAFYISINLEAEKSDGLSTKSSQLLSAFEKICWAIDEAKSDPDDKDPIMFSLLGYSFIANKNYEKANECFSKALEIKPDYELAKENKDLCDGMYRSEQCETQ